MSVASETITTAVCLVWINITCPAIIGPQSCMLHVHFSSDICTLIFQSCRLARWMCFIGSRPWKSALVCQWVKRHAMCLQQHGFISASPLMFTATPPPPFSIVYCCRNTSPNWVHSCIIRCRSFCLWFDLLLLALLLTIHYRELWFVFMWYS